jgi:hypothetical protein
MATFFMAAAALAPYGTETTPTPFTEIPPIGSIPRFDPTQKSPVKHTDSNSGLRSSTVERLGAFRAGIFTLESLHASIGVF